MTGSASLFLLILLPPADATGETALAMQAALRAELGEVTMAVAPDSVVTPAMWQPEGSQLHARFVAHLAWPARDRAVVELIAPGTRGAGARLTRELSFAPPDGKTERGRAIGLVLAALLREAPADAWLGSQSALAPHAAEPSSRAGLALGTAFAAESVRDGSWAMGPELRYDVGLTDALRLRASGLALFGQPGGYTEIGGGLAASWDPLRTADGRHALGLGLALDVFHEAGGNSPDRDTTSSTWNAALGPMLSGRVTLWRSLRLIGEAAVRACLNRMTLAVGDDANRTSYTNARWRSVLVLGLEYTL